MLSLLLAFTEVEANIFSAHVTLRALDIPIDPAVRTINLNPTKKTIKIGRASKSLVKGIQGATDNAWFDSPVMSRSHAEIVYITSDRVRLLYTRCSLAHVNLLLDYPHPRHRFNAWYLCKRRKVGS